MHPANNPSASYRMKILDMSEEERWNNNHLLMQETEHKMWWIPYPPKEASFIFFHYIFSKLDANWIAKVLRSSSRISTPKAEKKYVVPQVLHGIYWHAWTTNNTEFTNVFEFWYLTTGNHYELQMFLHYFFKYLFKYVNLK